MVTHALASNVNMTESRPKISRNANESGGPTTPSGTVLASPNKKKQKKNHGVSAAEFM
jgi:hypothetical protein